MQSWEIIPRKTAWGSECGGGTKTLLDNRIYFVWLFHLASQFPFIKKKKKKKKSVGKGTKTEHTINGGLPLIPVICLRLWFERGNVAEARGVCTGEHVWVQTLEGFFFFFPEWERVSLQGNVAVQGLILWRPERSGSLITWVSSCMDTWTLQPQASVSPENNC